ncbi:hypothetical protein IU501_18185 [Nocardia otitidiscaviarum]|uniref:hypothetical protein n=1 Tax=Nocardia otitidiscaviarum TaxID=1823 RepID=UPI0011DC7B43|nr:hypothetical protein [Nocardia otitidiscaviarum]MBF6134927.1 hypothetical protein [Nocardia otitidiscaviarum]MBF6485447.1 hypothetical protein [Nocardia otitidiscaviarum]
MNILEPEQSDIAKLPVSFDRKFSVDCITRTHRQLLLRSDVYNPNGTDHSTRIDIVFKIVKAMKMPFTLPRLEIRLATEEERQAIQNDWQDAVFKYHYERAYTILGGATPGYIVAGSAFFAEIDEKEQPQPMSLLYEVEQNFPPKMVYDLI